MSVPTTLRRSRAAFIRKRLRARCVIYLIGPPVTDPDTGVVGPSRQILYQDVPCYARYPGLAFEANHPVGGVVITDSRIVVRIPHEHRTEDDYQPYQVPVDALVEIVTDPDTPQMIGAVFQVKSLDDQSQATAQRLLCEDTQKGVRV